MSMQKSTRTSKRGGSGGSSGGILEQQCQSLVTEPRQKDRLGQILSGLVSRKEVEIVISRHGEDIHWSDMYAGIRTIYDKSGRAEMELPGNTTRGLVVALPNVGRESHTILWHIVTNYDRLANLTVFSQGSAPTYGYGRKDAAAGDRGGHLLAGSTFHDFVLSTSDKGHFVFTTTLFMPTLSYRNRIGFNKDPRKSSAQTRALAQVRCPDTSDKGTESRLEASPGLVQHIAARFAEDSAGGEAIKPNLTAFWQKYVHLPLPPHHTIFFAQGSIFSVTAAQIRRRPVDEYRRLLQTVSNSVDPYAGYFLEYLWFYVLTSTASPCPVAGNEFAFSPLARRFMASDRVV